MISDELLTFVLSQFPLDRDGLHGVPHWARVLENARRLAAGRDINPDVLELFALLHDSCRISDGHDRDHGMRAAEQAIHLRDRMFELPDDDFARLLEALEGHADVGRESDDPAVLTCWDAEKLELPRLGITPPANCMSTEQARDPEILLWAERRARERVLPKAILAAWGVEIRREAREG